MAGVRKTEWRIVRNKAGLNRVCPVCKKPIRRITENYGNEVRLPSSWFFINTEWGIEFVVHPACKRGITEENIFQCLKDTGQLKKKTVQDCLISIGLEEL